MKKKSGHGRIVESAHHSVVISLKHSLLSRVQHNAPHITRSEWRMKLRLEHQPPFLTLIRSLTRSLARSLAHSLAHSLTRSLTSSLTHPLTRPLTRSLARSLARSLTRSLARSFARSFAHSLAHSPAHLFSRRLTDPGERKFSEIGLRRRRDPKRRSYGTLSSRIDAQTIVYSERKRCSIDGVSPDLIFRKLNYSERKIQREGRRGKVTGWYHIFVHG